MGDLISRSALIELLQKNMTNDIQDMVITENNINLIHSAPTAYDIEKVVAELEKLKEHNKKLSEGAYLEDDKSFYFCAFTNFAKAIYIVRKGGVE